jgi:hypothetical protein
MTTDGWEKGPDDTGLAGAVDTAGAADGVEPVIAGLPAIFSSGTRSGFVVTATGFH